MMDLKNFYSGVYLFKQDDIIIAGHIKIKVSCKKLVEFIFKIIVNTLNLYLN